MLAGLLFAIHDADDRPDMLTATLPFGGMTLIEYQARLLLAAGASQLMVVVARLTPALIAAVHRIARRGIAVDTIRTAAEAAGKIHPLARVVMLADGLTTTAATIASVGGEGGDALLVLPEGEARGDYERIGGGFVWGGIARLDPRRLAELAAMPGDYDIQSTLIRLASQAHAVHVMLPPDAVRHGHGVELGGRTLDRRGRGVLAALVGGRQGWFDRIAVAPLARSAVPLLVSRSIPSVAIAAGATLICVCALALIWFGHPIAGLTLMLPTSAGWVLVAIIADLRDEVTVGRTAEWTGLLSVAGAALILGDRSSASLLDGAARIAAVAVVVIAALAEYAIGGGPRRAWWGSAPGYALILLLGAIVGSPVAGLVVAGGYAALTAALAIERSRRQP